jgi:signal transduction histidine kinase
MRSPVQQLVTRHGQRQGIPIEMQLELSSQRLPPTLEMAVFRITQEGLNNARRHSQASKIQLSLRQDEKGLSIQIEDDGVGFDPAQVPLDRHGVRGIQERAELAGGAAHVESTPGKGTRISVQLPLNDQLLSLSEAEHEPDAPA